MSHRGDPLATEERFERHPRIPGNCQRQLSYLEQLDVTCRASAMVRRCEFGRFGFLLVMSGIVRRGFHDPSVHATAGLYWGLGWATSGRRGGKVGKTCLDGGLD